MEHKQYALVVLRKGAIFDLPDTTRFFKNSNLPFIGTPRANEFGLAICIPIMDKGSEILSIAVYNTPDIEGLKRLFDKEPAIIGHIYNYEIVTVLGVPGTKLE